MKINVITEIARALKGLDRLRKRTENSMSFVNEYK